MMNNLMIFACVGGGLASSLMADDWMSWRGPSENGAAPAEAAVELEENEEPKLKIELPGRACSTPIVVDGKIILTTPLGEEDGVIAYDMEGKELWKKGVGKLTPGRGQRVGSSANSSPVSDGEHVYAFFKSGNLAALDMDGEVKWQVNIFETYGENKLWWDVGTSPVLAAGNVIVAVMQTDAPAYLVAIDQKTGDQAWKTDRNFETGVESGDAYTTPHVVELDGVETLVCFGGDHLTGHDAASGELLWTCGGLNPKKEKAWRVIASQVVSDGVAVLPLGRGAIMAGVKMGGSGDITDEAILWKIDTGTDAATPVARDGLVYLLVDRGNDRGEASCIDAESGEVKWTSELPGGAQTYYASPVVAGDKFYAIREDGVIYQGTITDEGLEDIVSVETKQSVIASPVLADGMLLVRGDRHLLGYSD